MFRASALRHLPLLFMKKTYIDQLSNSITLGFPAKKIVSLVPSQTELLFDLGLDAEIIGITRFCIHPEDKVQSKFKVGGTKKLNIEMIRSLNPDLVIGNKEENTREEIELLQEEFPVWMSDIANLEDALDMITRIGEMVDRAPEAAYLVHLITAGFNDLQLLAASQRIDAKVLYMIWRRPYMAAGRNTFIDDVLRKIGLNNVVTESRYPILEAETVMDLNPQLVLLSSEPYPFAEKHIAEFSLLAPRATLKIVDGEMFSWYGSRLVKAVGYLFQLQKELM
jgi:ABC-type Fe3+-hydroxamate transport system substrate-binding protein